MKHAALALALLIAPPALAQDSEADGDGLGMMQEGAQMFLRGLMSEAQPTIDDLQGMLEEVMPKLRDLTAESAAALAALLDKVDDFQHYQAPEFLENGDILIRRRDDAPPYVPHDERGAEGPGAVATDL